MRMIRSPARHSRTTQLKLYPILAVIARIVALLLAGHAAFLLLVGFTLEYRLTNPVVALMHTGPELVAGVLLWFLAKPLARLVTHGLE